MSGIKFLDCTLRDGGYYNSWDFSEELVSCYLEAISHSGVDVIEIGLRSMKSSGFKGLFAYTPEDHIRNLKVPGHLKVAVMVNATELLAGRDLYDTLETLFPVNAEVSSVDIVRVACHLHEVKSALVAVDWLKNRGFVVGVNLMQVAGQPKDQILDLVRSVSRHPVDVLYFADSLGGMDPSDVVSLITLIREAWKGEIGIHTHDNLGLALKNTLTAIESGVTWVDSTVTGMGRGPGNARTEELAIEIAEIRKSNLSFLSLIRLVQSHFRPLQQKFGWGTNPYYYLAGKYGIHPTYIQEMLGDSRYNETDVLAVISHLRRVGGRSFSTSTLDSARSFYRSEGEGEWCPGERFNGREVLLLGAGPGAREHSSALEVYIRKVKPIVMALNTQSPVSDELIDFRVACHPVRLLADAEKLHSSRQPIIMPYSMVPSDVQDAYRQDRILDFGLGVQSEKFVFGMTHCVLPAPMVAAYALAIASSGKASRVLMAGFDGYGAGDPRSEQMQNILDRYESTLGACPILSITPTRYKMPLTSLYLL